MKEVALMADRIEQEKPASWLATAHPGMQNLPPETFPPSVLAASIRLSPRATL
jgi:hypothetical protein